MFQWETHVSLGVLLVLIIVIIVPRSVFTKSSSIKLYEEDKRLLFDSDPWPPAEQKLEMPCDTKIWIQDEIFTLFKPQIVDRVDPHMPYIKVKL